MAVWVDKRTGWVHFKCDACGAQEDEAVVCSGLSTWIEMRLQTLTWLSPRRRWEAHACSLACVEEIIRAGADHVRVEVFEQPPASGVTRVKTGG